MNVFGNAIRMSIFGESHGELVGVTIDGCPAGIELNQQAFHADLSKRKSGQLGTTPRKELDKPDLVSGIYKDITTGAPITIIFKNQNTKSKDYSDFLTMPRPGHADFTSHKKFGGFNDHRGSGHFSGRITLGLVAAGVLAKKIISPVLIKAELTEAGGLKDVAQAVQNALQNNDTIGGIIQCKSENVPAGLGEPFFNSVESMLSQIIFSIPAIKAIAFGSGFQAASLTGSEHNDAIIGRDGKTETNHAGGINGGITNGNDILFKVAVKPPSSTPKIQQTLNFETGKMEDLAVKGRHDACIALRMPVIIEAATAFVLADLMLQEQKVPRVMK
jgi:chorismate synthase